LLRVLEDSCVRRLGGKSEIAVDVRVIASTNKVLEDALRKGESRKDLYCRLSVLTTLLRALRDRHGPHYEFRESLTFNDAPGNFD